MDSRGRDLLQAVAMDETQAPVAVGCPLAQLPGDPLGIVEGELHVLEHGVLGPLHLLLCGWVGGHGIEGCLQRGTRFLQRVLLAYLRERQQEAGLAQLEGEAANPGGLTGLHQRLVQAA